MTAQLKALLTYVKDTYPDDAVLLALVEALGGAQTDDGGGQPPPPPHT